MAESSIGLPQRHAAVAVSGYPWVRVFLAFDAVIIALAEFVQDDVIGMRQRIGDLAVTPLCLFLHQRVDKFDGREEPDALVMMLDGLDVDGCSDMRS